MRRILVQFLKHIWWFVSLSRTPETSKPQEVYENGIYISYECVFMFVKIRKKGHVFSQANVSIFLTLTLTLSVSSVLLWWACVLMHEIQFDPFNLMPIFMRLVIKIYCINLTFQLVLFAIPFGCRPFFTYC